MTNPPSFVIPPFFVAELSGNHRGQLSYALDLVKAAHQAGADGIKLQTFNPDQMAEKGTIIQTGPWKGRDLNDLYWETHTPRDWHKPIFDLAHELEMVPFSSVFHPDDVDFLEQLQCPIYKIASFEMTDLQLIAHAAKTGKPMIISTGMAQRTEIGTACKTAAESGCPDITLLKCTSAYPAPLDEMNLRTMLQLGQFPGQPDIGLSDHTIGPLAAIVATALGATVIEKHITLSRNDGGADAAFSAEPDEFAAMVESCKQAQRALGSVRFGPTTAETDQLFLRRKSGQKRGFI